MEKADKPAIEREFWDGYVKTPRKLFRRNWYSQTNRYLWADVMAAVGDIAGRRVLLVGCGEAARIAKELAAREADVWCLDISPGAIEQLMRHPFGTLAERVHPVVGDAENMPFGDGFFDLIVGKGIVHHLEVAKFMRELDRVCAPGARIVFCEPLGTNPVIDLVRYLTPSWRVPTEHPLKPGDIELIRSHCAMLTSRHCEFLTALSFPWFFLGLKRVGGAVHTLCRAMESGLFRVIPPARWLAWCVILVGRVPSPKRASELEKR